MKMASPTEALGHRIGEFVCGGGWYLIFIMFAVVGSTNRLVRGDGMRGHNAGVVHVAGLLVDHRFFAIDVLVFVVVGLILASEFVNLVAIVLGGRHVGRFGGGSVVVGCLASVSFVIGIGIDNDLLNLLLIQDGFEFKFAPLALFGKWMEWLILWMCNCGECSRRCGWSTNFLMVERVLLWSKFVEQK